jgi:glucose-6-phosphate 1-dehydrogenase
MRLIKAENLEKDSKIIFEKPFGHDLGSSDALNDEITKIFPEDKIYRIDHYLAKETVLNLATLKFSNPLINSLMNRVFVEKINVVADEDFGVGDRIEYYNGAGAIKDMIQSHLLQILALLLIDRPERLDPDEIHRKKFDVLTRIRPAINKKNTIGQYKSYSSELLAKGIQGSRTDTFAEICLDCDNDIWRGVPLWIRTGKKLKNKLGQIVVEFKTSSDFPSNELVIDIYPKQDIALVLNSRVPGSKDVKPVRLEFNREKEFGPNSPDEYSVLLQEMIRGEKLLFPRYGEIRESWRIVEDIEALKKEMKFIVYDDGSEPLNLKKNL